MSESLRITAMVVLFVILVGIFMKVANHIGESLGIGKGFTSFLDRIKKDK